MAFDPHLVAALHLHAAHRGTEPISAHARTAVQTSTIAALLDGAYDGDLTVAELLAAGDLGLGTLNGLDGELIVLDGEAWTADAAGSVRAVGGAERTPFAVVVPFAADTTTVVDIPLDHETLLDWLEEHRPAGPGCDAVRIDGVFDRVHARSVPKQSPPYRPLLDVVADQVEFVFTAVPGTIVGFRFPAVAEDVEVVGHHLHFISADRQHAGHVLGCALRSGTIALERVDELHLELPPGVELPPVDGASRAAALRQVEGG